MTTVRDALEAFRSRHGSGLAARDGRFELALLRAGGAPTWYVAAYAWAAIALGLVIAPLRTVRWLRLYRGCRSMYDQGDTYQTWLDRPLEDLRRHVRAPPRSASGGAQEGLGQDP